MGASLIQKQLPTPVNKGVIFRFLTCAMSCCLKVAAPGGGAERGGGMELRGGGRWENE